MAVASPVSHRLTGGGRLLLIIGLAVVFGGGTGHRERLRYPVVLTICGGAAVGAALSTSVVAPVIAMAAAGLAVFRYGHALGPR